MNEQEPADPQLQNFILAETQKQRFQVISPHIFNLLTQKDIETR